MCLAAVDELLKVLSDRFTPAVLAEFDVLLNEPCENSWENPVIVGLARRCFSLQSHLRRANDECDPHYLAWAARSLLELNIFAGFVTSSEANMRRFYLDLFVDGCTALNVASKSLDLLSADHTSIPVGRKIVEDSRPALTEHSDAREASTLASYLSPSVLAKSQGIEAEFRMSHTALSKFAHTTAASTFAALARLELASQFGPFLQLGVDNALSALTKLQRYVASQ